MKNVVDDRIEPGPVQEWYRKYMDSNYLNYTVSEAEKNGYILDPKSGLLIRGIFNVIADQLPYTLLDIIFPRPVDLHHHEDVNEALRVLRGSGYIYQRSGNRIIERGIYPGCETFIPKGESHTFRPYKNAFLEMRLACSGKLDSNKEVCEERFDEFEKWVQYYKL